MTRNVGSIDRGLRIAAGLLLLANIVVVAILSAPLPFRQFFNEPANTVIADFPWVWLPGVLVPVAYALHLLSWRQVERRASGARLPG